MLTKPFFDQWLAYLCQVKGWQLTPETIDRIYESAAELSDPDFGQICETTAKTVGVRPDGLVAGITDRLRQLKNDRSALPAGAIDPAEQREGQAFVKWCLSYAAARKLNGSLPQLSRLNPNHYGLLQDPLAPTLYQQIITRFGSWQNTPHFTKGRCAPIEQMIEEIWGIQLNAPPNPFDQTSSAEPIGNVFTNLYTAA